MSATALVWPVVALAGWTIALLARLGILRFLAVRGRKVANDYYRRFEGDKEPDALLFAGRNYSNLVEAPVLFYVACVLLLVLGGGGTLAVGLAWAYVVLRVIHSLIHITVNPVLPRFLTFVASNLVLAALWMVVATVASR